MLLFIAIHTQWRTGMNGPTGLDYNVLYQKMNRMKLTDAEFDQLERDIGVVEREALQIMRSKD